MKALIQLSITVIILLFFSCNNQKKEEKYEKIDIESNINITFKIVLSQCYANSVNINVNGDIYKLLIPKGLSYDENTDKQTLDIIEQKEFKLFKQQTDSIKSLISNIDNRLHCITQGLYFDTDRALLSINGNRIFFTQDFAFPQEIIGTYSDNPYLDKLIKYLIELSRIDVKSIRNYPQ